MHHVLQQVVRLPEVSQTKYHAHGNQWTNDKEPIWLSRMDLTLKSSQVAHSTLRSLKWRIPSRLQRQMLLVYKYTIKAIIWFTLQLRIHSRQACEPLNSHLHLSSLKVTLMEPQHFTISVWLCPLIPQLALYYQHICQMESTSTNLKSSSVLELWISHLQCNVTM